jgi:hypothetical protein
MSTPGAELPRCARLPRAWSGNAPQRGSNTPGLVYRRALYYDVPSGPESPRGDRDALRFGRFEAGTLAHHPDSVASWPWFGLRIVVLAELSRARTRRFVMSRSRNRSLVLTIAVLGCLGCSSYGYMREMTPDVEHSRKEYVDTNPGSRYKDDILAGRVREGMSRLQVRITWGDPDQVAIGTPGTEVWSYQEMDPSRGTAIYNLQFKGELLAEVHVDHAGTPLSTNAVEDPKTTKTQEQTGSTDATRKPGGFIW